jgi:class 3 adenylate cyclase
MDVHENLGDVTEADVKAAHQRDLEVQGDYGVQFLTFWFNSPQGEAFCLVDAPSKEDAVAVHKVSHGLVPNEIIEVQKPTVSLFMGDWERNVPNIARHHDGTVDTGLRAIMFTDLVESTRVSTRDGDERAMELIDRHDRIVRAALASAWGREVKHTGDGIFASFSHVSRAVECAIDIQRQFTEESTSDGQVRIGISAGEPVDHDEDLFGAAVNLAARICQHATPCQILVSSAVRELSVGKPFAFEDRGPIALKGFDDPVRLFEVLSTT